MQLQPTHQFIMMGCDGICGVKDGAEFITTGQFSQCSCCWIPSPEVAAPIIFCTAEIRAQLCMLAIYTLDSKPACPPKLYAALHAHCTVTGSAKYSKEAAKVHQVL